MRPVCGYPGGAADLENRGVIPGGRLSGQKARTLLVTALGLTRNVSEIRRVFREAGY